MGQKWQFRSADGSGNARLEPDMGKAGTTYSRSCTSTHAVPPNELPDPGLVYDMLIRRDKFVPHPAGLSGLFFNYATTVIHSVFRTSRTDWNVNETSSYVDMGILYGNTQAHQDKMRIVDGLGKIVPDTFAETRILSLPRGVTALLVMFNRNHNYLADMLLAINERGHWSSDLASLTPAQIQQQDYEIFNTARLINAFTYANVVMGDYLAGILGTVRDGSSWTLDIGGERREADHTILERGAGNSCSVEFNVLYRLHPAMSAEDAAFTEQLFRSPLLFGPDANFDEITPELFELKVSGLSLGRPIDPATFKSMSEDQRNALKDDSKPRDYLGLYKAEADRKKNRLGTFPRDWKTGRVDDDLLADALIKAISVPAASFKARGVPGVMRVIEILGIQQARNWGCCTLNEFRRFLGLKPYHTFEEWNPDPVIADAAKKLYRTPENIELYVGLVAEESKPVGDGAGLCPSYTMSRAILADAVALVRGDRHLTYDCTPFNLTAWGFTEASRNIYNAANGGMLGRIIQRGLPRHFPATSVYMHFPLVTPTGQPHSMDKVLERIGQYDDYTHGTPEKLGPIKAVMEPAAIYAALADESTAPLVTPYGEAISDVCLTPSFLTVIDEPAKYARVTQLVQTLFFPAGDERKEHMKWFYDRTLELVKEKSLELVAKEDGREISTHMVDVVKDVFRLVPVHWASTKIAGLPIKTVAEPRGIYYEQQMYQMLKEIYTYLYHEVDPTLKIPLRKEAKENVERLKRFVKLSLHEAKGGVGVTMLASVAGLFLGDHRHGVNTVLKRLLSLGSSIDETANDILAFISTASIELSQSTSFTHVLNFFLAPSKPHELEDGYEENIETYNTKIELQGKISALCTSTSPDAEATLIGYIREALRLDPVVDGVYRYATEAGSVGGVKFDKGDRLWFDLRAAGSDPNIFESPSKIDPNRPANLYSVLRGDTAFKVLGEEFVLGATAQVVKAMFSGLKSARRTHGPTGLLRRFKDVIDAPVDEVEYDEVEPADPNDAVALLSGGKIKKYKWKTVEGDVVWRWAYLNPEDSNRLTEWATGLTLNYDL
ncbi:heme peroxidase [Clavulina sp. PMI_390]|nr:heme peroxidase [Clavulina sp. PMI_390]